MIRLDGCWNWFGNIQCSAGEPPRPESEQEVADILANPVRYPGPVRPMGSRHSMTACMAARAVGGAKWGTAVDMTGLTGPLSVRREPGNITVTVPAGRTFFDVSRELRDEHGLQFRVITELGTLTVGAGACAATKDSSAHGEPGQVCADVVGMRVVRPDGQVVELRRGESDRGDRDLEAHCSSYGLFGIVTAVTFKVVEHEPVSLRHEELTLDDFDRRTEELLAQGYALFLYLFPFEERPRIVAEVRGKATRPEPHGELALWLRNRFWREWLHILVRSPLRRWVPCGVRWFLVHLVNAGAVSPVNQIVNFREGAKRPFTFSMWAFPRKKEAPFSEILRRFFDFCRSSDAKGFRSFLPQVSYHIGKDRSSLLSYSRESDVWTLDPIATGEEPGWEAFLSAFNDLCSAWGGTPLLNQTPKLENAHLVRAFGPRLIDFKATRRRFDPDDRMLNQYFEELLR